MANKRRGHNEGSIYQRSNGKWRAQITIDGHRLSFTAETRRECQVWLRTTQDQIDQGLSYSSSKIAFSEFLDEWLISTESTIRPSTLKQYRGQVKNHIGPYFGKYMLMDIKPEHIQRHYNNMVKRGIGYRTIQVTHCILHQALDHAVKLGLIPRNPTDATKPPKSKRIEMKFLNQTQAQCLLIAAKAHQNNHYALYHLALSTGMRQGELLGLKWSDLDWAKGTLQVQRQWSQKLKGGFEFTTPKTKAGQRTIALGNADLEALRAHQQIQYDQIKVAGKNWQDLDMIFTSRIGTPLDKHNLLKSFRKLLKTAGLPKIRFHDLRHTAASLMLNNGIPVIIVSTRLGHARPSITLDVYGHLIPGKQQEAAALMDELLTPISIELPQSL